MAFLELQAMFKWEGITQECLAFIFVHGFDIDVVLRKWEGYLQVGRVFFYVNVLMRTLNRVQS